MAQQLTPELVERGLRGETELALDALRGAVGEAEHAAWRRLSSSLYYAAFHLAKAALLTAGREPVTHNGVKSELNAFFTLDRATRKALTRLVEGRTRADYDWTAEVDRDEAMALVEALHELLPFLLQALHAAPESAAASGSLREVEQWAERARQAIRGPS